MKVKYVYLLFIQCTYCIMWKEHFFVKRTMQILCLFWRKYMMNIDHKMSCKNVSSSLWKVLWLWLIFNLGQVQTPCFTWAESNASENNPLFSLISIRFGSCEERRLNLALCMLDWGYPLRTYTMRHVSDIIFPRRILYKESNYCVFVFILASVLHCLFPATVVAQDLLMSLS